MMHTPFHGLLELFAGLARRKVLRPGMVALLVLGFVGCANEAGHVSPVESDPAGPGRPSASATRLPAPQAPSQAEVVATPGLQLEASKSMVEPPEMAPADEVKERSGASGEVLERGRASWYGRRFQGRPTASGEPFDMHDLTAAHKTLPFGTRVRVRSLRNGREVVVRINDRGPFTKDRVIDLSQAAMKALGLRGRGVVRVELLRE